MRSYGKDKDGNWAIINDTNYIWLATLVQTLRLSENESPIYGNYGIPGQQSVMTQIAPDAAVNRTQKQYVSHFANLIVAKDQTSVEPTYRINVTFLDGTVVQQIVT